MKNLCTSLRQHAKNLINFEKEEMLPLTTEELKSYQETKVFYIFGKRFLKKFTNDKNNRKIIDYRHCNLNFNVFNEMPVAFHNGSNYDYHSVIKELAKESHFKKE